MGGGTVAGWDLGGAHLKAAWVDASGRIGGVTQVPCPLWQGLERLRQALDEVLRDGVYAAADRHGLTMTGELADLFPDRAHGVMSLLDTFDEKLDPAGVSVYAGRSGFVGPVRAREIPDAVASANWLASVEAVAARSGSGLLVDVGSTTTDVVPFTCGRARARGYSDRERLGNDELVYTGVVRTPLMAIARRVPLRGEWIGVTAEHFATMADVYRLTGQLPAHGDQGDTADGAGKSPAQSAVRLARAVGSDAREGSPATWRRLAGYFAERQLALIRDACERGLSRELVPDDRPIVGAGVGRFVVQALCERMHRPYLDAASLWESSAPGGFDVADCLPAVAVAMLYQAISPSRLLQSAEW